MLANVEKQIMGAVQAGQVCYAREQRIVHTSIKGADGKDYPVECMGHLCKGNKHYMVVMTDGSIKSTMLNKLTTRHWNLQWTPLMETTNSLAI